MLITVLVDEKPPDPTIARHKASALPMRMRTYSATPTGFIGVDRPRHTETQSEPSRDWEPGPPGQMPEPV